MGTMVPGKRYIYEKSGGITYRREFGSQERVAIGWDESFEGLKEDKLWGDIRRAASSDPVLREMLDQVRVYYELRKESK